MAITTHTTLLNLLFECKKVLAIGLIDKMNVMATKPVNSCIIRLVDSK